MGGTYCTWEGGLGRWMDGWMKVEADSKRKIALRKLRDGGRKTE